MGDRSNIYIQTNKVDGEWDGIGVYSHWHGTSLHDAALAALPLAKERAGDVSYFARIMVHNVLAATADPTSTTGAGLWPGSYGVPDNEHPILVFNAQTGEYWYANEDTYNLDRKED